MDDLSATHRILYLDVFVMSLLNDELSTAALHIAHLVDFPCFLALGAIFRHVENCQATFAERANNLVHKLGICLYLWICRHEGVYAIEDDN